MWTRLRFFLTAILLLGITQPSNAHTPSTDAAAATFKTHLKLLEDGTSVQLELENTSDQSVVYTIPYGNHGTDFTITDSENKLPQTFNAGHVHPQQIRTLAPKSREVLYRQLNLASMFGFLPGESYQVQFKGWGRETELDRVPASNVIEIKKAADHRINIWDELHRRMKIAAPTGWHINETVRAVYRPVAGHDREIYGSHLSLDYRGDDATAEPTAKVELWLSSPSDTRQRPTLTIEPEAEGHWHYLTTISRGDVYLRSVVFKSEKPIDQLWPNAAQLIADALRTGGPAGLSPAQREAVPPEWNTLPIVRNWGNLRTLANPLSGFGMPGVETRFGISAHQARGNESAIVYCLVTMKETGILSTPPKDGGTLFNIFVGDETSAMEMMKGTAPPDGTTEFLLATAVTLDAQHDRFVGVTVPWYQEPFLQAQLINCGTPMPAWLALQPIPSTPGILAPRLEQTHGLRVSGRLPITIVSEAAPLADETPLMTPKTLSQTLELSTTTKATHIELKIDCAEGMHSERLSDYLLARWWINGTPYTPEDSETVNYYAPSKTVIESDKQHSLTLTIDPAAIGAKSGDRIGLQLLYSHDAAHLGNEDHLKIRHGSVQRLPELSNRIEFVAP